MSCLRLILITMVALVLSGCARDLPRYAAPNPQIETGFYEDIATPKLALLEFRLGEYFAREQRPYEVVCAASMNIEPSVSTSKPVPLAPEIEIALIERFPELSSLGRCEHRGIDVVARDTGVAAAIFDVNEFSCQAPDNCLGWGGYYANGPHGWSYYRMRFERGEWRIRREDLGIVLTGDGSS
ncbi:hypothetical protein [Qipengyuania sp. 902]|uniref:hypothetical protein n=1 Tax=Qipengyuania sp. 902 TaxID=3417565 RepID=UPI003EBFDF33